ncbi:MAG TPA: hypothetical protein VF063_03265 [Gaiellaceae bacterium]
MDSPKETSARLVKDSRRQIESGHGQIERGHEHVQSSHERLESSANLAREALVRIGSLFAPTLRDMNK